jgi:hypothetical protein
MALSESNKSGTYSATVDESQVSEPVWDKSVFDSGELGGEGFNDE